MHHFSFPPTGYKVLISPYLLQHLLFFILNDNSHSSRFQVISHCGFNLCFPDDQWCWATFHIPVGHQCVLFGKMSIQILCLFLFGFFFVVVVVVELYESFVYFQCQFLIKYMIYKYLFSFHLFIFILSMFPLLCRNFLVWWSSNWCSFPFSLADLLNARKVSQKGSHNLYL